MSIGIFILRYCFKNLINYVRLKMTFICFVFVLSGLQRVIMLRLIWCISSTVYMVWYSQIRGLQGYFDLGSILQVFSKG